MDLITIVIIALGLAMDAFAVSITYGLTIQRPGINNAFKIALSFGLFQAFMPVIGWLAGLTLADSISSIDHWVAFGLLSFIGLRMIYGSRKTEKYEKAVDSLNNYVLLMLSIATSIDALAIGVTFAFLEITIATPVIIIGIVTFLLSLTGVFIGKKIGRYFGKKIEIIGGLVLIGIGIKILIEHLSYM